MNPRDRLLAQLERDEGKRATVYKDHLGYDTIGIGRLVDPRKPGAGLRETEMRLMALNDIDEREAELTRRLPWFGGLDEVRRAALINMAFQLGVEGLMGFRRMLDAMRDEHYADAAHHALDSKWAKVDTPARAKRIARQIETGDWQ